MRAEGFAVSESTVGRILGHLIGRGVVQPVPLPRRARAAARARLRPHAGAAQGADAARSGQPRPARHPRHQPPARHLDQALDAYCPVACWTVAHASMRATSSAAAAFLDKVLAEMPFKVSAVQVDGGSEFMAVFETACAAKGLELFVLPPKSPQLNGAVERANGSWRYEFYAVYDLPSLARPHPGPVPCLAPRPEPPAFQMS